MGCRFGEGVSLGGTNLQVGVIEVSPKNLHQQAVQDTVRSVIRDAQENGGMPPSALSLKALFSLIDSQDDGS